jgi:hypothetical protein
MLTWLRRSLSWNGDLALVYTSPNILESILITQEEEETSSSDLVFRRPPAPAPPLPMSHPSVRPRRAVAAAARTNAAIDASMRAEAQTTRLGRMKKI